LKNNHQIGVQPIIAVAAHNRPETTKGNKGEKSQKLKQPDT